MYLHCVQSWGLPLYTKGSEATQQKQGRTEISVLQHTSTVYRAEVFHSTQRVAKQHSKNRTVQKYIQCTSTVSWGLPLDTKGSEATQQKQDSTEISYLQCTSTVSWGLPLYTKGSEATQQKQGRTEISNLQHTSIVYRAEVLHSSGRVGGHGRTGWGGTGVLWQGVVQRRQHTSRNKVVIWRKMAVAPVLCPIFISASEQVLQLGESKLS